METKHGLDLTQPLRSHLCFPLRTVWCNDGLPSPRLTNPFQYRPTSPDVELPRRSAQPRTNITGTKAKAMHPSAAAESFMVTVLWDLLE